MLPLFGRSKKTGLDQVVVLESGDDDWCVPSEQELRGVGRVESNLTAGLGSLKLETVCEVANESVEDDKLMFSQIEPSDPVMSEAEMIMVNCEDYTIEDSSDTSDVEVYIESEFEDLSSIQHASAFTARMAELERKQEELNLRVANLELNQAELKAMISKIVSERNGSNAPLFGLNEIVEIVQQVMKKGISYQQGVLGKFIDELDGFFDLDFSTFK